MTQLATAAPPEPSAPASTARRRTPSPRRITSTTILYIVLIALALLVILPLVWTVITSLKTDADAVRNPYSLPNPISLDAYTTLASGQQPILLWLWNSFAAATLQTVLILITASMGAYALARMDFAGKKVIFGVIIATLLVPPVVFLIPNYLIVQNFGWLDTILAITVPGAAGAFGIFFLRQFFIGLPVEIEEAARIDGAGDFRIFFQVVLPLARPALATLAVLSFLNNWNDFLWPVYVLLSPENMTLQPGLAMLQGAYRTHFAIVMAGAVIASVPVLILFGFAQRQIVDSVAGAAVKGMSARQAGVAGFVALVAAALLTACAGDTGDSGDAGQSAAPAPTAASGFVIDADFPDPDVVEVTDGYLAFATGTYGVNIQMAQGASLQDWQVSGDDALPVLPSWASTGRTWAPDVSVIDGRAVMYFTAEHTDSGRQCIGAATSPDLDGVYTPTDGEPLVCPVGAGGAIDPSTFVDSEGTRYLLWKTDGNCCGLDTWIEIAPLSADGLSLAGDPTRLIRQTLPWEGTLVEAPTLVKHGDEYVLFYSANDYGGDDYAVGAARSDALLGPYTKQDDPVLTTALTDGARRGPGGQDIVSTGDGDMIVFHSWDEQYIYRGMNVARLDWSDGRIGVDVG